MDQGGAGRWNSIRLWSLNGCLSKTKAGSSARLIITFSPVEGLLFTRLVAYCQPC